MTKSTMNPSPYRSPHQVPEDAPPEAHGLPLPPLVEPSGPEPRESTAAEEARTIVHSTEISTLASLGENGDPWASMVVHGLMQNGAPVLAVSRLAKHGRNLKEDPRCSLSMVANHEADRDPTDRGRVTLAGTVAEPTDDELHEARESYFDVVDSARTFIDFADFTLWIMKVTTVRWVGGIGRMASATPDDYGVAEPDPVNLRSAGAVRHLNEDHADALLAMARNLAGHTDALSAGCRGADRYGLSLELETERGPTPARIGFESVLRDPSELRQATIDLARLAGVPTKH